MTARRLQRKEVATKNTKNTKMARLSRGCRTGLAGVAVACLAAAAAVCAPKTDQITVSQAGSLARVAVAYELRHVRHDGFTFDPLKPDLDPRFYGFEALTTNELSDGSGVIGHYFVNKRTGDVWDTVTCKELTSRGLRRLQRVMWRQTGLGHAAYLNERRRGGPEPDCANH